MGHGQLCLHLMHQGKYPALALEVTRLIFLPGAIDISRSYRDLTFLTLIHLSNSCSRKVGKVKKKKLSFGSYLLFLNFSGD